MSGRTLKSVREELQWQGILKPLSREALYRFNFAVYDIETPSKESLEFYSCGFFDGFEYRYFRTMEEFLNHVLQKRYSGWRFFAHFGGRFDVHYVFDWLMEHAPRLKIYINCSGSCVIAMTIHDGRYWWRFTDSYRLFPKSLETLTNDFDVAHKKLVGWDYRERKYNEHDCRGLFEVLTIGFDLFGVCSETIASHALRVFRKDFLQRDIFQPQRTVEEFCRAAYFGGRCEIYRYDRHVLNHYDVNSLFPTAMLEPVPIEYLCRSRKLYTGPDKIGFYYARVNYPERYLPLLPVKIGKLFFPVGKFEGIFTGMELEEAICDGADVKIIAGAVFLSEPVLKDYSLQLFAMKQKAERDKKSGKRYVMKILANSLYGKWGQRREQRTYCLDDGSEGLYPLPNGLAYRVNESRATHILPHISAVITSRARLMQAKLLKQAQNWYTDTDSLFTSGKYDITDTLGGLHFEGRGSFQAYGLKEYKFKRDYKIKGLPRSKNSDERKRKAEDRRLSKLYLAGENVFSNRMKGFPECLRKGEKTVQRIEVIRHRGEVFPKRCRCDDDTRAWDVKEIKY